MRDTKFNHLGFTYDLELDIEPNENRKFLHSAINDSTKESKMLDFSPYERMNLETFQMIVELNFPPRQGCAPHNRESILAMWVSAKAK